jgi:hypothetical protein
MTKPPERQEIPVEELHLDPDNPRLPEELQGADQVTLLDYLHNETVLDELIRSFNDNGFFPHEPLIVVKDPKLGWVALEGNRRLAAIMVLTGSPEAKDLGLKPALEAPPKPAKLKALSRVPAYVVAKREDVHLYLGFRHIGGIKTWSAESKARYLMEEADRAAQRDAANPFLEVARRVGSNSQGVRNSYTAVALLRHARDEFGLQITYLLHNRFGVWTRCMTATDVRHYIGLNGGKRYEEVLQDIDAVERDHLKEVIDDLSPQDGKRPVVYDSRDVTIYGQVLLHPIAHELLRRHGDLQVARQVVELAALPERLRDLRERIDTARDEAQLAEFSSDLSDAADDLWRAGRALRATVQALSDDDEDEE